MFHSGSSDCDAATPNKNFFFASVTFKVQNELFRIPKFIFPNSETFDRRYRSSMKLREDSDQPVELADCNPGQFESFLTTILQPLRRIFPSSDLPANHPVQQPLSLNTILPALDFAKRWGFKDVRDDLQEKAQDFIASPTQKISLGKKYNVLPWFREGLEELVVSEDDISLEDADVIGPTFALRVYHARSRYARARVTAFEDGLVLENSSPLKAALDQVFSNDFDGFAIPDTTHTTDPIAQPSTAIDDVSLIFPGAGDRSPSFISVSAELTSSTAGSDTDHRHEVFEHHDYSTTDEEFYTRPPSVVVEDNVLGDSVELAGLDTDDTAVNVNANEGLLTKRIEDLKVEPLAGGIVPYDEDFIVTPRPALDPEEVSRLVTSPPPPPPASQSFAFPPPPSLPIEVVPISPPRAVSAPPDAILTKPVVHLNDGNALASTSVAEVVVVATKPSSSTTTNKTPPAVHKKVASTSQSMVPPIDTTTTKKLKRDDQLIGDVLRCLLDPELPMSSRLVAGVPKTCKSPEAECGSAIRCDPCCMRQAQVYQQQGWLPKARTTKGQIFLDWLVKNGMTGGMTTMPETLRFIPKRDDCRKNGKNCGLKKRCKACCEMGVREMLERGEII